MLLLSLESEPYNINSIFQLICQHVLSIDLMYSFYADF